VQEDRIQQHTNCQVVTRANTQRLHISPFTEHKSTRDEYIQTHEYHCKDASSIETIVEGLKMVFARSCSMITMKVLTYKGASNCTIHTSNSCGAKPKGPSQKPCKCVHGGEYVDVYVSI
jgi:hypothetical protein